MGYNSKEEKAMSEEELKKHMAELNALNDEDYIKAMLNYIPEVVRGGFVLREKKATSVLDEKEEELLAVVFDNLPNYIAFVRASRIEGAEDTLKKCMDYYAEIKLKAEQGDPTAQKEYKRLKPNFEVVLKTMKDK